LSINNVKNQQGYCKNMNIAQPVSFMYPKAAGTVPLRLQGDPYPFYQQQIAG